MEFNVDHGPNQQIRCTPFFAKHGCYCVITKSAKITPETALRNHDLFPPETEIPDGANLQLSVVVYWLPRPPSAYAPRTDSGRDVASQLARMGHPEVANQFAYSRDFLDAISGRFSTGGRMRCELPHEKRSPKYDLIWKEPRYADQ